MIVIIVKALSIQAPLAFVFVVGDRSKRVLTSSTVYMKTTTHLENRSQLGILLWQATSQSNLAESDVHLVDQGSSDALDYTPDRGNEMLSKVAEEYEAADVDESAQTWYQKHAQKAKRCLDLIER